MKRPTYLQAIGYRLCSLACLVMSLAGCGSSNSNPSSASGVTGPVTYNREVAPILFQNCAPCHRPGQSAPFSLLTYESARKHAAQIVELTQARSMPPWLPEPGYGEFVDERRLSPGQLEVIRRWAETGATEGDPRDLPPAPTFPEGWQLGEPDLVLQMPEPFELAAEGKDVYRNFLIPAPLDQSQFIAGVEFHPNNKSVHHVRILLDATGQSRRLDGRDGAPGFGGMNVPAKFPPGHMLTWVPGKTPAREPEDMAWALDKQTDLVLQIHMQRTGKPERVQPALGLYFTRRPPTRFPARVGLLSETIDIPAGESEYVVERSLTLPVDVDVLAVLPHLHYLGREIQAYALLPDGRKQWLLWIKKWDFNWQAEYRYRTPIFLPEGSAVHMHYSYDNSAANPRNPHQPPERVVYGPQSVDEMGELWLQLLPRRAQDLPALESAHRMLSNREAAAFYEKQLASHPEDADAHLALGKALGPLGRTAEAARAFTKAIELRPDLAEAHYYLALLHLTDHRVDEARAEFLAALKFNPNYFKAYDGLGMLYLKSGEPALARQAFGDALRINPQDAVARDHLRDIAPEPRQDPP